MTCSKVLCQPLEESSYRFVWSSPCVREGPHTTQSGHLGLVTTTEAAGRGADQLDAPHSTHAPQHSVVPPYLLLRKLQPSPHTSHLTPHTLHLSTSLKGEIFHTPLLNPMGFIDISDFYGYQISKLSLQKSFTDHRRSPWYDVHWVNRIVVKESEKERI